MGPDSQVRGWARAAQVLGCSRTQVRRLVQQGRLSPTRDERGRHLFSRSDLEAYVRAHGPAGRQALPVEPPAPRDHGQRTAAVFRDLEEGLPLVQIVIRQRLSTQQILELAAEWERLRAADLSAPSVPRQIQALRTELEQPANDLGERLRALEAKPGIATTWSCATRSLRCWCKSHKKMEAIRL